VGTEENKALVRHFVEEFLNKRNVAIVDELFAEDFVNHQGGLGPTGDRESLKQLVGALLVAFPDMRFEIEQLLAEGDKVFLHVIGRGTHTGEFMGIPATGRSVLLAAMSVVRAVDGKCAERWNITDGTGLMQQLTS